MTRLLNYALWCSSGQSMVTSCPLKDVKQNGFIIGLALLNKCVSKADPRTSGTCELNVKVNHILI